MANDTVELGSDGQLVVKLGPWARHKLFYIDRYCDIFNTGMKRQWATRCYIDLFAGPGKCLISPPGDEVDGSPLIALKSKTPFTHYFFNDENPAFVSALKARTSVWSPIATLRFFCKDSNDVIAELKADLPPRSLDFCFVDPFGWEIRFESIQELTENRRMDLAITFHTGQIKRFAHRNPTKIDQFMGLAGFAMQLRKVLSQGLHQATRYLLDTYGEQLRGIGYADITDRVLVEVRPGRPFYHLLFASKDSRGKDFWDKISEKLPSGQRRLL